MSEFLRSNLESFEDDRGYGLDITDLAVDGLSRVVGKNNDATNDDDNYREREYDHDNYNYCIKYNNQYYGDECADFDRENLTLQEIPLPVEILERYSFLSELPRGVAVMGGVARSIAREIITGEREPIRDIDLVNITDKEGNSEVDDDILNALSHKFMPDDYTFGHGVGDDTLDNYFKTRDFTVNQSLIKDGKLIISDLAYNDFQENIIRPTYFEHSNISSRLFLKALMMKSVLTQISDYIPLIEDVKRPEYIIDFDIALFLNKAMSRGAETARIFTEDLADWDIIHEDYAGRPIALAKKLLKDVYAFKFRPSTHALFRDVDECGDMSGFFVSPTPANILMKNYHASNPTIRSAIAEYEDDFDDDSTDYENERISGHYTQAEYDDINRCSNYPLLFPW